MVTTRSDGALPDVLQEFKQGKTNLTAEQLRLWFLLKLEKSLPSHCVCLYHVVTKSKLDIAVFQQSMAEVVHQFPVFHSIFVEFMGVPLCKKADNLQVPFTFISHIEGRGSQQTLIERAFSRSFDLAKGPLFHLDLIALNDHDCHLVFSASKMICDNHTANLFIQSLFTAYQGMLHHHDAPLRPLVKDASTLYQAECDWLKTIDKARYVQYWQTELANIQPLQFPEDKMRPAIKNHDHDSVQLTITRTEALLKLSAEADATIELLLLNAFGILLARYTQQTDFAIGLCLDNRSLFQDKTVQGNAENTIPLCINYNPNASAASSLRQLAARLQALAYPLPLKVLLENVQQRRDLSRTPVFQTTFLFEDFEGVVLENDAAVLHMLPLPVGQTPVDLSLTIAMTQQGLVCRIDYNQSLFSKDAMEQFLFNYDTLLEVMAAQPNCSLSTLDIINPLAYQQHVIQWNQTQVDLPPVCLHQLFEAQVKKTPSAIAVTCQGETIRYLDLEEQANQLAHMIQSFHFKTETKVAILLDRSIEMVVAMLAVLKSGCVYVPIEPTYPQERIQYMLADSGAMLLVTHSQFSDVLTASAVKQLCMDTDWQVIAQHRREPCRAQLDPSNLAYLIYTSGSTGKPKAVMVKHQSVVNNLLWRQKNWHLTPQDNVLHNTSFAFDPSVWSTFWPLSCGASFVIVPSKDMSDSRVIVQIMKEQDVTLIGTVPSLITLLLDEPDIKKCTRLRVILSGGEALSVALQQKIFTQTHAVLANIYGPTETTMDATYAMITEARDTFTPIGRPIANARVYILDSCFKPLPRGAKGEIYIGGVGVAKGYHGQDAFTAERFIADPFSSNQTARLYRSGDIGRIREEGELEYLGRVDEQIKIRGFRVELAEIEKVMSEHPNIQDVAVLLEPIHQEDARLVAYVVTKDGHNMTVKESQAYFSAQLPHYMLPALVHPLSEMPKMSNGKIDRQRLAGVTLQAADVVREHHVPRNPLEHVILDYFCDVLGVASMGIHDDFFEFGGTSLSLTRLASQLYQKFDVTIPLHQFFKVPTVMGIADVIQIYQRDGIDAVMAEKHATKLEEDAMLCPLIQPGDLPLSHYTSPNAVFLTGATGYLGTFLLQQLIEKTRATIYCLIRAKSPREAMQRIQDTMTLYQVWNADYQARIVPLCGDLGKPKFGLTEEAWENLAQTIDAIYHNGALVNFAYPYSALRAVNVLGTQEILRLSCMHHLKPVHYISTIDVLLATHTPRPFLEDDAPLRNTTDIPGGYTGSKWVSEKMMNTARERGLPVCIYRPGLIMSHTETGATQTNDYILVAFRGFVPMKIMPDYRRIFDIVPVDYVAKSVVHISMQPDSFGKFFHLFNPAPVSLQQFCDWTITYGYQYQIVPFDEGRERAMEVAMDHPLYPLVPLIRDADSEPQRSLDPDYMHEVEPDLECKNALSALSDGAIVCPPMSEQLTHLCLNYLVQIGYLPAPSELEH